MSPLKNLCSPHCTRNKTCCRPVTGTCHVMWPTLGAPPSAFTEEVAGGLSFDRPRESGTLHSMCPASIRASIAAILLSRRRIAATVFVAGHNDAATSSPPLPLPFPSQRRRHSVAQRVLMSRCVVALACLRWLAFGTGQVHPRTRACRERGLTVWEIFRNKTAFFDQGQQSVVCRMAV